MYTSCNCIQDPAAKEILGGAHSEGVQDIESMGDILSLKLLQTLATLVEFLLRSKSCNLEKMFSIASQQSCMYIGFTSISIMPIYIIIMSNCIYANTLDDTWSLICFWYSICHRSQPALPAVVSMGQLQILHRIVLL